MNIKSQLNRNDTGDKKKLQPYHIFECLGQYFVYDISARRFYNIEKAMYELLALCLHHSLLDSIRIMSAEKKYSDITLEYLAETVLALSSKGLFDIPDVQTTTEELMDKIREFERYPLEHLDLFLTDSCNLACKYCFCDVGRDHSYAGMMSTDIAEKAVIMLMERAVGRKKVYITFLGGEPLLNFKLLQHIVVFSRDAAARRGKEVVFSITTNGTLLDDDKAAFLSQNAIGVMVSLDGSKTYHNRQCPMKNGGDSFSDAVRGIKLLISHEIIPEIRTTLGRPLPSLRGLRRLYRTLGEIRRIVIEPAKNCNDLPSPVDVTEDEFDEWIKQEERELNKYVHLLKKNPDSIPNYFPYTNFLRVIANPAASSCHYSCGSGIMRCTVDARGTIFPCAMFSGQENWSIGNVHEGIDQNRVRQIWSQYGMARYKSCDSCWANAICRPSMPCDLIKSDGTFSEQHRFCRQRRIRIERAAYIYFMLQDSKGHIVSRNI